MKNKRAQLVGSILASVGFLALCGLVVTLPMWGVVPVPPNSILNLYDGFGYGKRGTTLDWGYSALIHYNGKTILFDAGNRTDVFEHNVKALGVDLSKVDIAVLFHYHADHFSGFGYLLRVNPHVRIYLPDEPELGAPIEFEFSNESKEDLQGIPPEELYFGGEKNTMTYVATGSLASTNHETVQNVCRTGSHGS